MSLYMKLTSTFMIRNDMRVIAHVVSAVKLLQDNPLGYSALAEEYRHFKAKYPDVFDMAVCGCSVQDIITDYVTINNIMKNDIIKKRRIAHKQMSDSKEQLWEIV